MKKKNDKEQTSNLYYNPHLNVTFKKDFIDINCKFISLVFNKISISFTAYFCYVGA